MNPVMRSRCRPLAAALTASLLVAGCAASGPRATSTPSLSPTNAPSATELAPLPTDARPPLPTEAPLSTVSPIPPSDSFGAGLLFTCGGPAFPIELLETPPSKHLNPDPAPALIRWPVPTRADAWWLIARTETQAEYLGRDAAGRYESARLERGVDGIWNAVGWGGCRFYAVVPGAAYMEASGWWIREADWPKAGDRTLRVRVRAWCPRTLADRMLEPIIRYGSDRIIAIVGVRPSTQEPSECGDDPEDQVGDATIELEEPVGQRMILDAKEWPGRDAHIKTEPMGLCCG